MCVIDCGIYLQDRGRDAQLILGDSPPVLKDGDQVRLPIEAVGPAEQAVSSFLRQYGGWHPFCRILASVTTIGGTRVRPVMFSFATPQLGLVGQPQNFFEENNWDQLRRDHESFYTAALEKVLVKNGSDTASAMRLNATVSAMQQEARGSSELLSMKSQVRIHNIERKLVPGTAAAAAVKISDYEQQWHNNIYSFIAWTAFYYRVLRYERRDEFANALKKEMFSRISELKVDIELLWIVKKHGFLKFPLGAATLLALYG